MNNRKKYTYGLENESILINEQGIPQYFINEQKTSTLLIKLFQKQYPHLKNMIKPELDACQIELINPNPHTSLEKATQEIAEGLYRIATIAKNFGLSISPDVAPKTQKPYTTSDTPNLDISKRYEKIGQKLEELGVRTSTNIAGLHINIGHQNNEHTLIFHQKISQKIYNIITNNEPLPGMDPQRYQEYKKVTQAIGENYLPISMDKYTDYIDEEGNPIPQGHTFVRLKRYIPHLVSELRTPDAGTSPEDLYKKINNQSEFLSQFL